MQVVLSGNQITTASSSFSLLTVRSDEGVDLQGLESVQGLDRLLDLVLVGAGIDNENNRVLLLDLVHRAFGRQGILDNVEVRLDTATRT